MAQKGLTLWAKSLALWLLLMSVETVHGLWREKVLSIWLGDFAARQVCVFTGSLLILFVTYVCIPWIPARKAKTLFAIGVAWLGLTIAFEFAVGHFALQRSWEDIASDFNPSEGHMFPIGLAILTFTPLIAAGLRGVLGESPAALEQSQINGRPCDLYHKLP